MTLIRRRRFLIAAGALLSAPYRVLGQQSVRGRIGFLQLVEFDSHAWDPFRQRMGELGYVEGKNLIIEWRSAENRIERLPSLAAELVDLRVDVIVTPGTLATRAAQKSTTMIPIVMVGVG